MLLDIIYKKEWRSDLDFVRCVKLIYNLSSDVNSREGEETLLTVTDWQAENASRAAGRLELLWK